MRPYTMKRPYRRKGQRINTLKKGVYILPNLLTSLGLLCGFYAIIAAMRGSFVQAAWAIIIAALFDNLDGRIARLTNTTTRFGLEYDSLADMVAFGVAPALLAYCLALSQYGRWGWLAAFLFVACGAMRLARFNTLQAIGISQKKSFTGLPIPAAAGLIASITLLLFDIYKTDPARPIGMWKYVLAALMVFLSFMTFSQVRYPSFKNITWQSRRPLHRFLALVLLLGLLLLYPRTVMATGFLLYLAYGFLRSWLPPWLRIDLEDSPPAAAGDIDDISPPESS